MRLAIEVCLEPVAALLFVVFYTVFIQSQCPEPDYSPITSQENIS